MRVLVGGVATHIGYGIAARLRDDPTITAVFGLDACPLPAPLPGVHFVRARVAQPEWRTVLRGVDVAVWLVGDVQPPRWGDRAQTAAVIADLRQFLAAVRGSDVGKLIVVNDAALYGAQRGMPVAESAAAWGHSGGPYARARARAADYLDAWERSWPGALTRLRPALVAGPHYRTLTDLRLAPRPLVCGRAHRPLQVIAEHDLTQAVTHALRQDMPGVYNLAAGAEPICDLLGDGRGCAPWIVQWMRAWWGWRWHNSHLTPEWLARIFGGVVLDVSRWRAAGGGPGGTSTQALAVVHNTP